MGAICCRNYSNNGGDRKDRGKKYSNNKDNVVQILQPALQPVQQSIIFHSLHLESINNAPPIQLCGATVNDGNSATNTTFTDACIICHTYLENTSHYSINSILECYSDFFPHNLMIKIMNQILSEHPIRSTITQYVANYGLGKRKIVINITINDININYTSFAFETILGTQWTIIHSYIEYNDQRIYTINEYAKLKSILLEKYPTDTATIANNIFTIISLIPFFFDTRGDKSFYYDIADQINERHSISKLLATALKDKCATFIKNVVKRGLRIYQDGYLIIDDASVFDQFDISKQNLVCDQHRTTINMLEPRFYVNGNKLYGDPSLAKYGLSVMHTPNNNVDDHRNHDGSEIMDRTIPHNSFARELNRNIPTSCTVCNTSIINIVSFHCGACSKVICDTCIMHHKFDKIVSIYNNLPLIEIISHPSIYETLTNNEYCKHVTDYFSTEYAHATQTYADKLIKYLKNQEHMCTSILIDSDNRYTVQWCKCKSCDHHIKSECDRLNIAEHDSRDLFRSMFMKKIGILV